MQDNTTWPSARSGAAYSLAVSAVFYACISVCAGRCFAGENKPVQRLAGQAANGPDDSLPFVLDDNAVAPAFQQAHQQQGPLPGQKLRQPYSHTPASAAAGKHFCGAAELLCVKIDFCTL